MHIVLTAVYGLRPISMPDSLQSSTNFLFFSFLVVSEYMQICMLLLLLILMLGGKSWYQNMIANISSKQ